MTIVELNQLVRLVPIALGLAVAVGCSKSSPAIGRVSGTVTKDGRPQPKVSVLFTPISSGPSAGPPAGAVTDTNGKYSVSFSTPSTSASRPPDVIDGCAVGMHTVTLADFKMMDEMLPAPGRVPAIYSEITTSPLRYEVIEGAQIFDIELK